MGLANKCEENAFFSSPLASAQGFTLVSLSCAEEVLPPPPLPMLPMLSMPVPSFTTLLQQFLQWVGVQKFPVESLILETNMQQKKTFFVHHSSLCIHRLYIESTCRYLAKVC